MFKKKKGAGLGIFGKFRIVTEKTIFSMPESKIGFFCDIGTSYILSRIRNNIGIYLSLNGRRLSGKEMVKNNK